MKPLNFLKTILIIAIIAFFYLVIVADTQLALIVNVMLLTTLITILWTLIVYEQFDSRMKSFIDLNEFQQKNFNELKHIDQNQFNKLVQMIKDQHEIDRYNKFFENTKN